MRSSPLRARIVPLAFAFALVALAPLVACDPSVDLGTTGSVPGATKTPTPNANAFGGRHEVTIHVRSTAVACAHADSLAGSTPPTQTLGFGGLDLGTSSSLPSEGSPNPLVSFNGGEVEASLTDGTDTVVAKVDASLLAAGTYRVARMYVTHIASTFDATFHPKTGPAVLGVFRHLLVLSESSLDGMGAFAGDLHHTFVAGGTKLASFDCDTYGGDTCPDILPWSRGTLALTIDKGIGWYTFPIDLPIDASFASHDSDLFLDVNVHEDVRWQDATTPGFSSSVFDTTATSYEPVMQFGPNSITARLVAKP